MNSDSSSESVGRNVNSGVSDTIASDCSSLASDVSGKKTACAPSIQSTSTPSTSSSAGASGVEIRCGRSRHRASSPSQAVAQHRNRMSQLDTLFISACAGVVHGDENAVRSFLRAGGDRTRALTSDEAFVLNARLPQQQHPGLSTRVFRHGETLVHIALA